MSRRDIWWVAIISGATPRPIGTLGAGFIDLIAVQFYIAIGNITYSVAPNVHTERGVLPYNNNYPPDVPTGHFEQQNIL